jgi:hypothetical protein
MTRKGEGKSNEQRVAICNSRFRKAKAGEILLEEEAQALSTVMGQPEFNSGGPVSNLKRKKKKKKKDKFRITVEDGSGTDPTVATEEKKKKPKKAPKKKKPPAKDY